MAGGKKNDRGQMISVFIEWMLCRFAHYFYFLFFQFYGLTKADIQGY